MRVSSQDGDRQGGRAGRATSARPGRRITMEDVARHAGVSLATVSHALNRHTVISAATRRRVIESAMRLGYERNSLGRSLAARRSYMVAVVVGLQAAAAYDDPYFAQTMQGVWSAGNEREYLATLVPANTSSPIAEACLRLARAQRVDGCILAAVPDDDGSPEDLVRLEVPFVVLGTLASAPSGRCIDVDNVAGMNRVVAHLLALGHRRFAFIAGLERLAGLRALRGGFVTAVAEAGGLPAPQIAQADSTLRGGHEAARRLLDRSAGRPTALVCANDLMAAGAVHGAQDLGLRVPDDVSVTGVDDNPLATVVRPHLTTLRKPVGELGVAAMRRLLTMIDGGTAQDSVPLAEMPLVVRQSTSGPPSG